MLESLVLSRICYFPHGVHSELLNRQDLCGIAGRDALPGCAQGSMFECEVVWMLGCIAFLFFRLLYISVLAVNIEFMTDL